MSDVQSEAQEAPERDAASEIEAHEEAPEVHESVTRAAQALGWVPKDKYRRPDKWVDAETFLAQQPARFKNLQDQVQTVAQTADRIFADNRKRMEQEIRAEIATATEAGDHAAVQEAASRLADVRTPKIDPQDAQRDFARDNPWFGKNRAATALAREAAGEIAAQGIADPKRQFEAAERAVREEFPDLFSDEAPEARPSRSSPSRGAPAVEGGHRAAHHAQREKGYADLPGHVKVAITDERLAFWGMPPGKEGRDRYARTYFKTQEQRR